MLRVIDLRGRKLTTSQLRRIIPRGGVSVASVVEKVAPIVSDIQHRGAAAALDYSEQFDGIRPTALRVPQQALDDAVEQLDPKVKEAIEVSIERVRKVHAAQKPQSHTTTLGTGATVTEVFRPVERVGLYVPGGKAVRSEEHTSELQSRGHLVCRLLLEKKNTRTAVRARFVAAGYARGTDTSRS